MSDLLIRRLDPADDADMEGFQEVYAAAELAEDPDAALYSREDGVAILTQTQGGELSAAFGAFVDDRMVGELMVSLPQLDNLDLARVWLWVHPSHQRRGVGTRLAQQGHAYVRDAGRHLCQAQGRIGADRDNGNLRFAKSLGYDLANTEIERRLALPADADRIARLEVEATPYHRDYEIRAVVGPVPDDLADSYIRLKNLLTVEAPPGELVLEPEQDTVSELAAQDRDLAASGRTRVAAYALTHEGEVAGYSVAAVSDPRYQHVDQWGTLVDPAHRGHRLGTAVKCAMLRSVSESFPDKRFIGTTNAETNAPMVAINEALGFEVVQVYGDFQVRLA